MGYVKVSQFFSEIMQIEGFVNKHMRLKKTQDCGDNVDMSFNSVENGSRAHKLQHEQLGNLVFIETLNISGTHPTENPLLDFANYRLPLVLATLRYRSDAGNMHFPVFNYND